MEHIMTRRAFYIPPEQYSIHQLGSLPWVFEGEKQLTSPGDGYVEVDGYIEGFNEISLREVRQ